jgi:hypothetical protein
LIDAEALLLRNDGIDISAACREQIVLILIAKDNCADVEHQGAGLCRQGELIAGEKPLLKGRRELTREEAITL